MARWWEFVKSEHLIRSKSAPLQRDGGLTFNKPLMWKKTERERKGEAMLSPWRGRGTAERNVSKLNLTYFQPCAKSVMERVKKKMSEGNPRGTDGGNR